MRFITLFLVLSMVILMAEPGDAFFHHIIGHVGTLIHGLIHGHGQQREQMDDRFLNREQAFN